MRGIPRSSGQQRKSGKASWGRWCWSWTLKDGESWVGEEEGTNVDSKAQALSATSCQEVSTEGKKGEREEN